MSIINKIKVDQDLVISALVYRRINELFGKRYGPTSKGNLELVRYLIQRGISQEEMLLVVEYLFRYWAFEFAKQNISPDKIFGRHAFFINLKKAKIYFNTNQKL